MYAMALESTDGGWIFENATNLPPIGSAVDVFVYDERKSTLLPTGNSLFSAWNLIKATWNVIEVPTAFDVIDIVLVNTVSAGSSAIYGIQITRSPTPFKAHSTFDTCHLRSKEKLDKLWLVIANHFKLDDTVKKFFVMLAPNCKKDEFRPPVGHLSDYLFSPAT